MERQHVKGLATWETGELSVCRAWRAWFQQPGTSARTTSYSRFQLSGSDALPTWWRLALPTLGFKIAFQKPTCDVMDTTSMFYTVFYLDLSAIHSHAIWNVFWLERTLATTYSHWENIIQGVVKFSGRSHNRSTTEHQQATILSFIFFFIY